MKTTLGLVRDILINSKESRDNDLMLLCRVWEQTFDPNLPSSELLKALEAGTLPHPESVRRLRQLLQSAVPELRGKKWEKRHKTGLDVKDSIAICGIETELPFFDNLAPPPTEPGGSRDQNLPSRALLKETNGLANSPAPRELC